MMGTITTSFKRYLYGDINWDARLIEITGARGVGKTTLMLQKVQELNRIVPDQAVYLSLDDKILYNNSLIDIVESLNVYGVKYIFLDEVHKYPAKYQGFDWSAEIKNIYDRFPEIKVIYSGSSVLNIYKGHGDLSRRKTSYRLAGFSFREYLNFSIDTNFERLNFTEILKNHKEIAINIISELKIIPLFKEYLKTGYFPFYNEAPEFYSDRLNSILNVIIETDIPAVSDISFETSFKLKKMLAAIASSAPYVPNLLKMRKELFIADQRTLLKYLDFLEKAEVIYSIGRKTKGNKIMQKPAKIYLGNTNFFYSLNMQSEEIGTIRETFFISQVSPYHSLILPENGDFIVDNKYVFEIGGKNKGSKQIKGIADAFIVLDDIEFGVFNQIPLWLFGFLY